MEASQMMVSLSRALNTTHHDSSRSFTEYHYCNYDSVCLLSGGGCEWEDTLPFVLHASSPETIPEPQSSPTSIANSPEAPKPAAVALNRFMVSRFSITHVSDAHQGSEPGL